MFTCRDQHPLWKRFSKCIFSNLIHSSVCTFIRPTILNTLLRCSNWNTNVPLIILLIFNCHKILQWKWNEREFALNCGDSYFKGKPTYSLALFLYLLCTLPFRNGVIRRYHVDIALIMTLHKPRRAVPSCQVPIKLPTSIVPSSFESQQQKEHRSRVSLLISITSAWSTITGDGSRNEGGGGVLGRRKLRQFPLFWKQCEPYWHRMNASVRNLIHRSVI